MELTPDTGSKNVDVMFVGIPSENAGWRATLVAVNEAGESRYSRMTKGGRLSMPLLDAKRVVLAIAATPTKYVPDLSQPGYGKKPRFPYMVAFRGAKPSTDPGRKIYVKGNGAPQMSRRYRIKHESKAMRSCEKQQRSAAMRSSAIGPLFARLRRLVITRVFAETQGSVRMFRREAGPACSNMLISMAMERLVMNH